MRESRSERHESPVYDELLKNADEAEKPDLSPHGPMMITAFPLRQPE